MRALMPPAKLNLSDWMEREIRLPEDVALPGPIRLYPFQRGMADAISDPAYTRVTVLKSARVGYTTLLVGAIANHVVNDPAKVLAVLPTDDDCRRFVVDEIEPTFSASPALSKALSGAQEEGGRNTMVYRRFAGGSLRVVAARAPRNLRAHTARILILDEVDGMEPTKEGLAPVIVERRTMSFPDRKILIGSTPTDLATSYTIRQYGLSDKRIFEVPCPKCGVFSEIVWKDIRWPEGEPHKAYWCCPACENEIDERFKGGMVEAGQWRATAPHVRGHAGFRLSSLISPLENARWGLLAAEFIAAKDDPETLKVFINTVLGEGAGDDGEDLDEVELSGTVERFGLEAIPADVLAITMGVDVQHGRLEATLIGWTRTGVACVLAHIIIWGAWDDDATWTELDDLLRTRWRHPLGGRIGIDAACVDSGDGATMDRVYEFCFPRARRRVMAIKGMGGSRPWILGSQQQKRGGTIWIVGVDGIKTALFARLRTRQHFRFSDDLGLDWFEQLAGERQVVRYRKGAPIREFVPVSGRRHEALDCVVYAMAAHKTLNIDWDRRIGALEAEEPVQRQPKIAESTWL